MENLDIIIFAFIAGILLWRLWAVFGRRNDEDQQRPNPFAMPAPGKDEDAPFKLDRGAADKAAAAFNLPLLAPASLLGGLAQVKESNAAFDEKNFLRMAREIFTSVVNGFAKGDLVAAEPMLSAAVLANFKSAIAARQNAGETLESRIRRISDAEVTEARVEDSRAYVTVRFVSEQENILRDEAGGIVSGGPGKAEEITDIWTFERDSKAPVPEWKLIETR